MAVAAIVSVLVLVSIVMLVIGHVTRMTARNRNLTAIPGALDAAGVPYPDRPRLAASTSDRRWPQAQGHRHSGAVRWLSVRGRESHE
jgi:hypothetical protein